MKIVEIREKTVSIASEIKNAFIDFRWLGLEAKKDLIELFI